MNNNFDNFSRKKFEVHEESKNTKKRFEINHEFQSYSMDTLISDVAPIEEGGINMEYNRAIETFVEFPLVEAVKSFHEKGINTIFSSANTKDISAEAYIVIEYDSLSEFNKKIAESFSDSYFAHGSQQLRVCRIAMGINEATRVADVVMGFRDILSRFENQN